MKKNNVILAVVALLFVGLLAGALVLYNDLSSRVEPDVLAPQEQKDPAETDTPSPLPAAPDFTMEDKNGAAVALSSFHGKPVVLNFWASWCGPCKSEMPAFEDAFRTYGDRVHFVMVNLTDGSQETLSSAKAFLESSGYTFPVYFDTRLEGAARYGVVGIPASFFINAEGRVVAAANTALSADMLDTGIHMILEE